MRLYVNNFSRLTSVCRSAFGAVVVVSYLLLQGCAAPGSIQSSTAAESIDAEEAVPQAAMVAYQRALQAMASGDTTDAELELEHLILEYPDYAGPYVNLAILYRGNGDVEQAIEVLNRALGLDSEHPAANNQLGMLLRAQGQFADAEAAYLRAIAADPEYALAYYNLGILLDIYLQRPAEALQHYERYQDLTLEPDRSVAGWIIDLRRRLGITANATRVAQEVTQ